MGMIGNRQPAKSGTRAEPSMKMATPRLSWSPSRAWEELLLEYNWSPTQKICFDQSLLGVWYERHPHLVFSLLPGNPSFFNLRPRCCRPGKHSSQGKSSKSCWRFLESMIFYMICNDMMLHTTKCRNHLRHKAARHFVQILALEEGKKSI